MYTGTPCMCTTTSVLWYFMLNVVPGQYCCEVDAMASMSATLQSHHGGAFMLHACCLCNHYSFDTGSVSCS